MRIDYYSRLTVIKIIKVYQKTISFDHGIFRYLYPNGFCRFRPTCSEYAIESITKKGLVVGGIQSIWRIMRCNPWNKGGWDPVK